jgi:HK97 family phage portal protein
VHLDPVEQFIAAAVGARMAGDAFDPYGMPVVVAARGLIADTLAQLPLVTIRGRRPLPVQPQLTVRPNRLEPRWLTFHRAANNLTRYGYVWFRVTDWDAAGRATAVRCIDALDATADWDPVTGELDTVWQNGDELVPGLEIVWVPYNVERRASYGEPPLGQCAQAVQYLGQLWTMAGSFWEAGYPSLVVSVKQRLGPGQATAIKQQLIASMAGRHEPGVVDQDGTIAPIGASPLESQLVESFAVANAEMARAFRMPPSLVNVAAGDSLTYATTEGEFRRWLATGLSPYLSRIEAAFDDLTPAGQRTRFDTTELLRSEFTTRVQAYSTVLSGAAWMTVDEVRDLEGLDPMTTDPAADPAPMTLTDAVPGA